MGNLKSSIFVKIDKQLKDEADIILKDLGLNMSTFINMALVQVVKRRDVPFEITNSKPSDEFLEALAEIEDMKKIQINILGIVTGMI